jgi:hypothetical protein
VIVSRVMQTRGCGSCWRERGAEIAGLRAGRDEDRELIRRLGLRLAELERRLDMDSTDSGTPSSKERIGAKEARKARQQSERERSKDRKRGGQPGHQEKARNGIRIRARRGPRGVRGMPVLQGIPGRRLPARPGTCKVASCTGG